MSAGPGAAGALPAVTYRGGATITAHLQGERPGYSCQIAAHDIDGPWRTVDSAGTADLDSGALPPGRHRVRVICEDRARGDVTTHVVGAATEVTTG
ncbi:hypothetical protein EBN03_29825 [Nocardia stercoris]|uniref:Uncharacterized protein n=1 Tax=Nocardia stercoris TaxID=2483361 RepID=A0A3M2L219_9NOCA|nr:hypothetical protein EBN03_29825 [Nocardia stercoris]